MLIKIIPTKANISNPATNFFDTDPIIYSVFRMSKCRINKYKPGFGGSFSQGGGQEKNGSLDNCLAAKLASRDAQDSKLWNSGPCSSPPAPSQIIIKPESNNTKTRENDIDIILGIN
jgi:hypothetical protein